MQSAMNQYLDNGLNVNASPWSGPASLSVPIDVENQIHTVRNLSQPSSQVSLFPPSVEEPSGRARQICKFFLAGGCSRGDSCPFLHELPKDSTLMENTDSTTSVTGIVFSVNAKNTFSALQKQSIPEGSGLTNDTISADRDLYAGEYSPIINDLATEYYPSYLGNEGYSSHYATANSWSNQLTSEIAHNQHYDPNITNGVHSYRGTTGSIVHTSPSAKFSYNRDYSAHKYPSINGVQKEYFGKDLGSTNIYWQSNEFGSEYIDSSGAADGEMTQGEAIKSIGPLSYAAVAQKKQMMGNLIHENIENEIGRGFDRRHSPIPEHLADSREDGKMPLLANPHLETSPIDMSSPGAKCRSNTGILERIKSPSLSNASPYEMRSLASGDDIEPQWKPISKLNVKAKHHEGRNLKATAKPRKNKETDAESSNRGINSLHLPLHSTAHKSMSSHKIQLPNPTLWARRSIPEILKRPMHALIQVITANLYQNEGSFSISAESEYLKPPVALHLDAIKLGSNSKANVKMKSLSSEVRVDAGRNIKGARKPTNDAAKDRKDRILRCQNLSMEHFRERGSRTMLRGRGGYGGQAYHENRIHTNESK